MDILTLTLAVSAVSAFFIGGGALTLRALRRAEDRDKR